VLIGPGLLKQSPELFEKHQVGERLFLISNPLVSRLFTDDLARDLSRNGFNVVSLQFPDGEKFKNLQTVENIYTDLIDQGADRSITLVAVGGGVTGDVVGFVASTFLRGVRYIQIPTTLLSQVDSSVGGKTGVNHQEGKNLIGAFYQPYLVCADTETLLTLPQREFQSGAYEVLKYGLIGDLEFFNLIASSMKDIQNRTQTVLTDVVRRCCEVKVAIVSSDETEKGLRRILNFGHTFGHALEAVTQFKLLTHGEAIGYGMLAATHLSISKGYLDASSGQRIIDCVRSIGSLPSLESVLIEDILQAMKRDKKRAEDQNVFVLLRSIGNPIISTNIQRKNLIEAWERAKESAQIEVAD